MSKSSIFVYILRSSIDNDRYVGLSKNIKNRFVQHNSKKVHSTRSRAPFTFVYSEQYDTLAEAREREKYLKTATGRRWLDKMGF